MPHLPVEIIHQISCALLPYGGQKLAPLATINRHWQGAIEAILWRYIGITTADIDVFTAFCQTRTRRQAVRHVIFDAEYFKRPAEDGRKVGGGSDDNDDDGHEKLSRNENTGDGIVQEDYEPIDTEPRRDDNDSSYQDVRHSLSAFQAEHCRFFHAVRKLWDTVASWGSSTEVKSIQISIDGCPMYEHLGLAFRNHDVVHAYLCAEDWLGHCPPLPVLPSVEVLIMGPKVNTDVDLWSAIAGCAIARSLPALKKLDVRGDDRDRRWEGVRRECREVLAKQLRSLPSSLESIVIWLSHSSINDQRVEPSSFLVEGVDNFSTAIHHLSSHLTHLTKLFINVNHISPSLFWSPNASNPSFTPHWPNLSTLDIRTGFETAAGAYWMRSASDYPASVQHLEYHWGDDTPQDDDGDGNSDAAPGYWPVLYFRIRPDPSLFDALAISVAHAISHMPKLVYLNLEFNAHHRGPRHSGSYEHFKNYQGWACYFRAGNSARLTSNCFDNEWPDPGPDWTDIERPRLEWVFQCPYREVQWRQPDEANALWRAMFPDVDFDLVTLDYRENKWYDTWERRRDGKVVCRSRLKFK